MAKSFKSLLGDDIVNTRTLLHEAIPITGTIVSGTYQQVPGTELNIKTFSHGMFQSIFDYPFLRFLLERALLTVHLHMFRILKK